MSGVVLYLQACLVVSLAVYLVFQRTRASGSQFPGPKSKSITGSLLDVPHQQAFKTLQRWGKAYDGIFRLGFLGKTVLVLCSRTHVDALLDQRAAIYSDRPGMTMSSQWEESYDGDREAYKQSQSAGHRHHRKMMTQCFGPTRVKAHQVGLRKSSLLFVSRVAENPSSVRKMVKLMAVSNLAKTAFGFDIPNLDDPFVTLVGSLLDATSDLGPFGSHPADLFPSLSWVPTWIFGKSRYAAVKRMQHYNERLFEEPFQRALDLQRKGLTIPDSALEMLLASNQSADGKLLYESMIKAALAAAVTAGIDTTWATLDAFLLAMITYPDVQATAKRHIDDLLQGKRLPEFGDRDELPYLDALILELWRWSSVAPLGLPHKLAKDDTYWGHQFEPGTVIISNVWAVMNDESTYSDPEVFRPERFLTADGTQVDKEMVDPRAHIFGYGRRICPGRYLADSAVWMAVVTILSTLDLSSISGEDSKGAGSRELFESHGVIRMPKPFQCVAKIRSQECLEIVHSTLESL